MGQSETDEAQGIDRRAVLWSFGAVAALGLVGTVAAADPAAAARAAGPVPMRPMPRPATFWGLHYNDVHQSGTPYHPPAQSRPQTCPPEHVDPHAQILGSAPQSTPQGK
jgi:hypothetical protein